MFQYLEKISRKLILIISVVFVLIIGIIDYITGAAFPLVIIYFLPMTIVVWYVSLRSGVLLSFICTASSVFSELFYTNAAITKHIFIANALKRLLVFLVFSIIVYALKKNLELSAKNKLIIQRSQAIIDTSQRTTGVIVESITKHNSELLSWINKQKENGQHVPEIIEVTQRNIGESLRALSEASFCETVGNKELDVDDFIGILQKKVKNVGNKIFSK